MLSKQSTDSRALRGLVGASEWTERTHQRILDAATLAEPVLISGGSGPGRELIARQIHAHSVRADRPFIPFRNGRLPARFVAQQLFGHGRGQGRLGRGASLGALAAAEGGTLFIDEVADLSLESQARLVEALLKNRAVDADVDSQQVDSADRDVRLIAYSSRDLESLVAVGQFNPDLYCLLNTVQIEALPLEQRIDQLLTLARNALASLE